MDSACIAFVAYEALRAWKRVQDPKGEVPAYWYDIEDPDAQMAFQNLVKDIVNGEIPDVEGFGGAEALALVYAVVHALHSTDA